MLSTLNVYPFGESIFPRTLLPLKQLEQMKNLLTTAILLFAMTAGAQEMNKKYEDPTRSKQVLLNLCTREGLTSFPEFKESYDANYAAYKVDSTALQTIASALKDKNITIVLGTWCGDSKYQVPNFLKILDAAKVDPSQIKYIGVDGKKHAENGLIDQMKITNVPTFIFTDKKGTEVARITEHPTESLEKDMVKLLTAKTAPKQGE